MDCKLRIFILVPLAALLACGGGTNPPVTAASPTPSGDYVITISPATAGAGMFNGALAIQGTNVTGVFRFNNPGAVCVSGSQDIPVAGSISTSNAMTLTSGVFSGSTATFTIQLPLAANSVGAQIANGTAQIAGGTCALPSSPLIAQFIPSYSGTWTGNLTGPNAGVATVVISQSGANSDGQFPTSATVAFAGATCSFSAPAAVSGLVSGYTLQLGSSTVTINASAASSPVTFNMNVAGSLGCQAGTYAGTISRQ